MLLYLQRESPSVIFMSIYGIFKFIGKKMDGIMKIGHANHIHIDLNES